MERGDFYADKKWCEQFNAYVHFLLSIDKSFCVECGGVVHLFSKDDWRNFRAKTSEAGGDKAEPNLERWA
jgi:hypothetical protein